MVTGVWGHKIGMTQIFSDSRVTPVTAITIGSWFIAGVKTQERDGYDAIQVACVRDRYKKQAFSPLWLQKSKKFFEHVREVKCEASTYTADDIGKAFNPLSEFAIGSLVDVVGWSRGLGFQGVYKRHGFGGAAKSHGSMMGRRPGSIGFTRSSGEIMRGQKMAGHKGCQRTNMRKLRVMAVEADRAIVMVKGSVPGKSGSLVLVKKA